MKKTIYIIGVLCSILGCAEHDSADRMESPGIPISIGSSYPSAALQTRAIIDGGFVTGDEMGIFVVDRDEDGQPGTMALQGNRASNIRFTLQDNGSWQASTQLYWDTKGTSADFFGYYPFDGFLSSVNAQPFSVSTRQDVEAQATTLAGYIASDLLWGKKENVSPTTETVTLQYQHIMAGVTIRLEQGTGFTADEWTALDKTLFVANTIPSGTVDLSTGAVEVGSSSTASIRPLYLNGNYRAVVFPQTVAAGKELIQINIDGQTYSLKKAEAMTFASGKMHQFTVTVNRRIPTGDYVVTLADEAIVPWADDADMHEGLVHQYVLVEVVEPGTLGETLMQQVSDPAKVKNLKVVGTINQDDLSFLWNNVTAIERLNLLKTIINDGVLNGMWLDRRSPLQAIIFPEKGVKEINRFINTSLKGSLNIPEGVERLGWHVFSGNNLNGTVTLPSTLKYTDMICEYNNELHGDFHMPESMVEWGGIGGNYTGTMYLPPTLKKINGPLPGGLTGTIVIPQGCEVCDFAFAGSQCTSLILPEGMEYIPVAAFDGAELRGEVRIPSTVTTIKERAFCNTKISRVIMPENVKVIEERAFNNCSRLSGTMTIPKNVVRIPAYCFENCQMLTGIVLHKDVAVIDHYAFAACNNLNSIVCEGEEPPAVVDDAFLGVPKDNFTVEVPKGCVEKYRNARGWSDFKRISEYSNFVCRPAEASALNNAHQEELVLNADGAWTAETPDWVTLSKTSGTGKTALTLTFQNLAKGAGNRTGVITFTMNVGSKTYTTTCKVSQYDYDQDEDGCLTLQQATKGNNGGIDIVFVGDGYDGQSISDGSYLDLVRYQTECFFAVEPYKSMRQYFNVYVTFPLSQEKGVNTMYTYVNNRFGTLYGLSSLTNTDNTSSQLITESDEVMNYVVEKTPVSEGNLWCTLIILVPNSTDYEGHTEYTWDGKTLSICPPSEQPYPRDTRGVIQHEAGGHGFGKLGDEMITRNAFATVSVKNDVEDMHSRGWFANLATTGKLSSVPWSEFIFDPDYSDYVDVFEGGYGFTRGIYRPEANSCMNFGIPYYNTPSRLSIYHRILDYAGESFSMASFRAQDTFEWGPTEITRSAVDRRSEQSYVTGNHQKPMMVDFRKMGVEVRGMRSKLKNKK